VSIDWSKIVFTEHVTEAAIVIGQTQVVIDFGAERASYDILVYEAVKGGGDDRYFAVGTNRDDAGGYRPTAAAATAEEAVQRCLSDAGIFHRRRVKQAGG